MIQLPRFTPPFWAQNSHLQTILGRYWTQHRPKPSDEQLRLTLPDGDALALLLRRTHEPDADVVCLFHGLGGSTDSDYMPRTAEVLCRHGFHVLMANHRGCGPGEGLASRPYHSGRADDVSAVISEARRLFPKRRVFAIGFSLSGNALLLLMGDRPDWTQPDAAISVNAPIDLALTADLLTQGINRVYDLRFVADARREIQGRLKSGLIQDAVNIPRLATLKDVDAIYTAPLGGFESREEYYRNCSALPHLGKIRVPTLMITAADDPFVSALPYLSAQPSPKVQIHIEEHGGHMGFLSAETNSVGSMHWLDEALLEGMLQLRGRLDPS